MSSDGSRVSKLTRRKKSRRVELEGMSRGSMLKRKEGPHRTGFRKARVFFRSASKIQAAVDCEDFSFLSRVSELGRRAKYGYTSI